MTTLALVGQLKQDISTKNFPDYTQNYQNTVVQPCTSQGGHIEDHLGTHTCVIPPPPPPPVYDPAPPIEAPMASQVIFGSLTGSLGYSLPYGNCVDEPGVNNPGFGNPISWPVLSSSPSLGATVLFTFNHTAVVSGIWSNGDIEVRQQNSPGMPHRIPASEIRGYR